MKTTLYFTIMILCLFKIDLYSQSGNYVEYYSELTDSFKKYHNINKEKALFFVDLAQKLGEQESNDSMMIESEFRIGSIFVRHREFDKADSVMSAMMSKFPKVVDYSTIHFKYLLNRAFIYKNQGRPKDAIEIHKTIDDLVKITEDHKVWHLTNMGAIYMDMKDYSNSVSTFKIADSLNQVYGTDHDLNIKINMAIAYSNLNDFQNALHYYKISLPHIDTINSKAVIPFVYNNMATSYLNTGDTVNAIRSIDTAILKNGSLNSTYAVSKMRYANIHLKKGEYRSALNELNPAIEILENGNDKFHLLAAYKNRLNALEKFASFDSITNTIDSIYTCCLPLISKPDSIYLDEMSFRVKLANNKSLYDQFNKYIGQFKVYNEGLIASNILESQQKYNLKNEYEHRQEIQKERDNEQARNKIFRLILAIGSIILFSLIALLYYIYKLKNEVQIIRNAERHSTSNNYQRILSTLQDFQFSDEKYTSNPESLKSINLVGSIASIHNILARESTSKFIKVLNPLHSFCKVLSQSQAGITINFNCEKTLKIHRKLIQPLYLLIEELFTNSVKHINTGGINKIDIDLNLNYDDNDNVLLSYKDSGQKIDSIQFNKLNIESNKLEIIKSLVKKMEGELKVLNNGGLEYKILFPWSV